MILKRGASWRPFSFAVICQCVVLLALQGCHSVEQRTQRAAHLAQSAHFQQVHYTTSSFTLYAQEKIERKIPSTAHIYIEGDGYAWARLNRISPDPTPRNPVGLRLASQDPHSAVIYLARPCQYTKHLDTHICHPRVWTSHRASPQVVASLDEALDQLKQKYSFSSFVVFGYSGGGTIAALLAAKRQDIKRLVTIAGNLDPEAWVRHHGVSPLEGSLTPVDFVSSLSKIPQVHFVGAQDEVVPPFLAKGFLDRMGNLSHHRLVVLKGQGHHQGWDSGWQDRLKKAL